MQIPTEEHLCFCWIEFIAPQAQTSRINSQLRVDTATSAWPAPALFLGWRRGQRRVGFLSWGKAERSAITLQGMAFYFHFLNVYFFHYSQFTVFCQFSTVQQSVPVTHTYTHCFSHIILHHVPPQVTRYSSLCYMADFFEHLLTAMRLNPLTKLRRLCPLVGRQTTNKQKNKIQANNVKNWLFDGEVQSLLFQDHILKSRSFFFLS